MATKCKISLVKVITRFHSQSREEVSLEVGDIWQVLRRIDRLWLYGRQDRQEGRFPANSVIEVSIDDETREAASIFVAKRSFVQQEEGDLGFERNDIIIGQRSLNENWFEGHVLHAKSRVGMFPITYTWKVSMIAVQDDSDHTNIFDPVGQRAVVIHDMSAKLDQEINLRKGDMVMVFGNHDDLYYYGESQGNKGIFPKSFVTLQQSGDSSTRNDDLPSYVDATKELFKGVKNEVPAYGSALYGFEAMSDNELSFQEGQLIHLIRHVDSDWIEGELDGRIGIFPTAYIEIIVDCEPASLTEDAEDIAIGKEDAVGGDGSGCGQTVQVEEYPKGTKADVLYDFDAQMDGDLTVRKGEEITLLRKFNNDWVEAYNQLELGICPFSYIKVRMPSNGSACTYTQSQSVAFGDNLIEFSPERKPGEPIKSGPAASYDAILLAEKDQLNYTHVFEQTLYDQPNHDSNSNISKQPLIRRPPPPAQQYTPAAPKYPHAPVASALPAPLKTPSSEHTLPPSASTPFAAVKHESADFTATVGSGKICKPAPAPPKPPPPRANYVSTPSFTMPKSVGLIEVVPERPARWESLSRDNSNQATDEPSNGLNRINSSSNSVPPPTTIPSSATAGPPSKSNRETKMEEQRTCVIVELLQSERDYLDALRVCYESFVQDDRLMEQLERKGLNVKLLAESLSLVIDVSSRLVEQLQSAIASDGSSGQLIGQCFTTLESEIGQAYGQYCRMHADFQPAFEKCEQQEVELYRVLQRALEKMRSRTNCFDIQSVLIKPVQRILKYPLLLNELIKCTVDTNPDKPGLLRAIKMITDLATNINELKRRKDLVVKYRNEADRQSSFSSRLSKLNMHTLKKKYSRFNFKFSSTIGLAKESKDEDFEQVVHHFRSLEKSVKLFLKNLAFFIESLEAYVRTLYTLTDEIALFYGERANQALVEQCRRVYQTMLAETIEQSKIKIDTHVDSVLKQLLGKFSNPIKLIDKRKDKQIDFDRASRALDSNKDSAKAKLFREEYSIAKGVYEALHQQLLQELPQFVQLGTEVFLDCLVALIAIYKRFIGRAVQQMLPLLSIPPIDGTQIGTYEDIVETFTVKHNLIAKKFVEDFLLIPATIFPQAASGSALASAVLDKQKLIKNAKHLSAAATGVGVGTAVASAATTTTVADQTEQDKLAIINNMHIRKQDIYMVTADHDPIDLFDLRARKGDLVVVIKKKDPTGLSSRWFVDNGKQKGFLPERFLQPRSETSPTADRDFASIGGLSTSNSFSRPPSFAASGIPTSASGTGIHVNEYANVSSFRDVASNVWPSSSSADAFNGSGHVSHIHSYVPESASILSDLDNESLLSGLTAQARTSIASSNATSSLDEFDPLKESALDEQMWAHLNEQIDSQGDINLKRNEPPCNEYHRAAYSFDPIGPKQLHLALNEIVVVKYKCDLHRNPEWWYIENQAGKCGYVPANYLSER